MTGRHSDAGADGHPWLLSASLVLENNADVHVESHVLTLLELPHCGLSLTITTSRRYVQVLPYFTSAMHNSSRDCSVPVLWQHVWTSSAAATAATLGVAMAGLR